MPAAFPSPLVAVDANVVMDLGEKSESVMDALATIRQRLRSPRIVLTPTATLELMHITRLGDTARERDLALSGMTAARRLRIVPVNLMPVGHGIVELMFHGLGLFPTIQLHPVRRQGVKIVITFLRVRITDAAQLEYDRIFHKL